MPGTDAYRKREGDAEPDEIAVIPDKLALATEGKKSPTPGGQPIPMTVVQEAPGSTGPHSEEFEKRRRADAPPDLVLKPDGKAEGAGASTGSLDSATDRGAPGTAVES